MGRLVAIFFVALLPSASAAWLQDGGSSARTGVTDSGPDSDDLAFRARLAGGVPRLSSHVHLDGAFYAITQKVRDVPELATNGIWRVDLESGAASLVRDSGALFPTTIASDGERLYVTEFDADSLATSAVAYLVSGEEEWRTELPRSYAPDTGRVVCAFVAIRDASLYYHCVEANRVDSPAGAVCTACPHQTSVAFALDAASGSLLWSHRLADSAREDPGTLPRGVAPRPVLSSVAEGLAIVADTVVLGSIVTSGVGGGGCASVFTACARSEAYWHTFTALDVGSGSFLWDRNSSETGRSISARRPPVPGVPPYLCGNACGFGGRGIGQSDSVTGDENAIVLRLDDRVLGVSPRTGRTLWATATRANEIFTGDAGSGFAYRDGEVYVAEVQNVYKLSAGTHEIEWRFSLDTSREEISRSTSLPLARDVLHVMAVEDDDGNNFTWYGIDAGTGELRWDRPLRPDGGETFRCCLGASLSVSGGLAVVTGFDGWVSVFGRTPLSPVASSRATTAYPDPGETVVVDLSRSSAGAAGPPTSFRADWGDGTVTDWQPSPSLSHAYAERGERLARFSVRNDAGQGGSETVLFRIGEPEPNLISEAFAPERQEATFFLLGLAATGVGGAIQVTRIQRRRARLRREIAAVDDVFREGAATPFQRESALADARLRAKALVLGGKLDDAQGQVLERHVEDLARRSRVADLDDRFDFLPRGMARRLEGMLADGSISSWERSHFLDALDRDALLTPEQKAQVRALVDGWFSRDAGGLPRPDPGSAD